MDSDLGFNPADLFDDAEGKTGPSNGGRRWTPPLRMMIVRRLAGGDTIEHIAELQGRSLRAVKQQRDRLVIQELFLLLSQPNPEPQIQTMGEKYQLTPYEMEGCYQQAKFQRYRIDYPINLRSRRMVKALI